MRITMNRRVFVLTGLATAAARTSQAATGRVEILPEETIGVISPDIYGHFVEHLGGCIYDGIWVGEKSPVANVGGIRKALVDALRRLKPPVIRWPGGCFADSYNWRDGVGPMAERPRRTNFWAASEYLAKGPDGPQKYDPNHFGTNEFVRFCSTRARSPTWRRTCAARPRAISMSGWNTATPPPAARLWPTCAPRAATAILST
jgi:alpha-L-arabinofuranosidase